MVEHSEVSGFQVSVIKEKEANYRTLFSFQTSLPTVAMANNLKLFS